MADSLHKLKVIIEGSDEKLKRAAQEARQTTRKMMDSINAEMKKIKAPLDALKNDKAMEKTREIKEYIKQAQIAAGIKVRTVDYVNLTGDISRAERELEKLQQRMAGMDESTRFSPSQEFKDLEKSITSSQSKLDRLLDRRHSMEMAGKASLPTDDYVEITSHLEEAQARMESLIVKQKEWQDLGVGNGSSAMKTLTEDIRAAEKEVSYLKGELEDLEESKQASKPTEAFRNLTDEINRAERQLQQYRDEQAQIVADGSNLKETESWRKISTGIANAQHRLEMYNAQKARMEASGSDVRFSGGWLKDKGLSAMSKTFNGLRAVFSRITSGIRSTGGAFSSLIQRFRSGVPHINRTRNSMNDLGNSSRGLGGMFRTIGMTARFMFASFAVMGTINAAKEGLKNLAQYSQTTNANLSQLKSGLNQLQNSLATAFAPILNVVTPILDTLISYLVAAANAVAQFMAALTGQSSYTIAKRVATDFAAGAAAAGSAAGSAADEAERLQRTLMGFDQINKLDDTASFGGGSGGGGAGGGAGDLFGTETVENQFADFANKIRDAWTNADFTEIGTIIGTKLKEGLDNIPWEGIQDTAKKIGKSVATLINGFVETSGLGQSIGNTVAQAINAGVLGANAFLTNLHWESVGQFVADGLNGFIANTNWSGAGIAVRNGINGVFRLAATWSGAFDFSAAGNAANTAINSVLAGIDWSSGITAAANIGKGIATALNKAITPGTFSNIGGTVAGAVNTVVSGAYSLIGTVDWSGWGSSIASGLNRFFRNTDWTKAGISMSNLVNGILSLVKSAVTDTNWSGVGKSIGNMLAGIDWGEMLANVGEIIMSTFVGLLDFAGGLWKGITETDWDKYVGKLDEAFQNMRNLNEEIMTNIEKAGDWKNAGEIEYGYVEDLAKKYFDLADKAGKSNEERDKMRGMAGELVKTIPQLQEYYNEETGLLDTTRGAVMNLIDALKAKAKTEAAQDALKTYYTAQFEAKKSMEESAQQATYLGQQERYLADRYDENKYKLDNLDESMGYNGESMGTLEQRGKDLEYQLEELSEKQDENNTIYKQSKGIYNAAGKEIENVTSWMYDMGATAETSSGEVSSLSDIVDNFPEKKRSEIEMFLKGLSEEEKTFLESLDKDTQEKVIRIAAEISSFSDKLNDKTLGGFLGVVATFKDSLAGKTLWGFLAALSGFSDGIRNKGIGGFRAGLSSFSDGIRSKGLSGFIATITGLSNGIATKSRVIGSIKANITSLSNGIAKNKRVLGGLKGILTSFKQTSIPTITVNATYPRRSRAVADGGLYSGGRWRPITAAANGGSFSTGQMFVAREAGPELVGSIGRSTAVMNNNQIVSSVAAGVYSAVSAAMGRMGGGNTKPVFNIFVGGRQVTDVVIEEVNNRTMSTGQCPILT